MFSPQIQSQQVVISNFFINQQDVPTVNYFAEEGRYFVLWRGEELTNIHEPVRVAMGSAGDAMLQDLQPLSQRTAAFYVLQSIPLDSPLDLDGDGLNDVFELLEGEFLNPLNAMDAFRDSDGDGVTNLDEFLNGTDLTVPNAALPQISEISPAPGESMVSVARHVVIRFNTLMDEATIDENAFFLLVGDERIEGEVFVSPGFRFATFIPDHPLPPSAEVRMMVRGDVIRDAHDQALDADHDGIPGGDREVSFRTLPLTRIVGTTVWGFVKDSFTEEPIVGATIRVDAIPEANVVTDENGRFELEDMPAPEFFVHIDGSTALNVPDGYRYPNVGKPFHSVPGQSVQIAMEGQPFDIYLPLMADDDVQTLSESETTAVGFGRNGKQGLETMFPDWDPSVWDFMKVDIAPGSAINDAGEATTQAAIIPVPPDRIPAPLPPFLEPRLVVSVQAGGATRFEVPAAVTFPNLDGLPPGSQSLIWSFNHAAGKWEVVGTGTVSEDGSSIVSDPGVGIRAPGWHFSQPGSPAEPCPPADPSEFVLPELEMDTLLDHLFFDDSGEFTLRFANVAPPLDPTDPCSSENLSATPMCVEVCVLGPANEFLEGLDSGFYDIPPNGALEFEVRTKTLLTEANVASATRNILYGVDVLIVVTVEHPEQGQVQLLSESFYVYRLFDIADDNHTDGVIEFEKTFVDGTGGVVRAKPILLNMLKSAKPIGSQLIESKGEFLFSDFPGDETDEFWFDPEEVRPMAVEALMLHSPRGPLRPIVVRGPAVGPQFVFLSSDRFYEKAIEVEGFPGTPRDAFEGGVAWAYSTYTSLGSEVGKAIQFIDVSSGSGILVNWALGNDLLCRDFLDHVFDGAPPACAPWADFDKMEFLGPDFAPGKLSAPEEEFRFTRIVNRSPIDAPPQVDFSGVAMNLDVMADYALEEDDPAHSMRVLIANALAHEIGHDLGNIHFRDFKNAYLSGDVMGSSSLQKLASFGPVSGGVVKMALGIPISDSEFNKVRNEYAHLLHVENYRFNNNLPGLHSDLEGLDAPLLTIFDGPVDVDLPSPEIVYEIDLGTVLSDGPGGQTANVSLFAFSNGDHDLVIESMELQGQSDVFSITGLETLPVTLTAPDPHGFQPELSTRQLNLSFDPNVPGKVEAVLRITSNSIGLSPLEIPIRALALSPFGHIAVELPNNNAGGARLNDPAQLVENFASIENLGAKALVISDAIVFGGNEQFTIAPAQSWPLTLQPGEVTTFNLEFGPQLLGLQRAVLEIHSDDPNTPVSRHPIVGTGLSPAGKGAEYGFDFVAIEFPFLGTASLTRLISGADGSWTAFLAPSTDFHAAVFDPVSGFVAHLRGQTSPSGEPTRILPPAFRSSIQPDTDGDGLPDDIEFAIGTSRSAVDTDHDGIDDFTEIQSGEDPLDGIAMPTGVIARVEVPGRVEDVTVAEDLAYLVGNGLGLAVVDVADAENPIVLGRLDFALGFFELYTLAVDSSVKMAAVASSFGVIYLVNVADPMVPQLHTILPLEAEVIAVADGLMMAGVGSNLHIYDLVTAQRLQILDVTEPIHAMEANRGKLYLLNALTGSSTSQLQIIDISRAGSSVLEGALSLPTAVQGINDLTVAEGRAFVTTGDELLTVDVQDPETPLLVGAVELPNELRTISDLALNGSGLGVYSERSGWLFVRDFATPEEAIPFVGAHEMPGAPQAVALHSGFALVADFGSDLSIVNYLALNPENAPPSATISSSIPDIDPESPGIQIAAGSLIPLELGLSDDTQVNRVGLIVNGESVLVDDTPPFDLEWRAPRLQAENSSFSIQVVVRDHAGAESLSNILNIQLVEDLSVPNVVGMSPPNGFEQEHIQALAWHISEAIDPAAIDLSGIHLTFLGEDNMPGGGDDLFLTGWELQLRSGGRTLLMLLPPNLPAGAYQLIALSDSLRDYAGNSLAEGVHYEFSRLPSPFERVYTGSLAEGDGPVRIEFEVFIGAWVYFDSLNAEDNFIQAELIDPLGQEVFSHVSQRDSSRPILLKQTGIYTLVLGDHAGASGDYAFRLLDVAHAPEMPLDQDVEGLLDPGLEADIFRLPTLGGRRYFLNLLSGTAANEVSTGVRYPAPENIILTAFETDLLFKTTIDGTYFVLVETSASGEADPSDYRLRMVTPETFRFQLVFNTPTSGTIGEPGELHIYRFDAHAGQSIFFDGLGADLEGIDVNMYGPDGRSIGGSMSFSRDSSRPILVETTGRYRLEIGGESDVIGNYSFQLMDLNQQPLLPISTMVEGTIDPASQTHFYQYQAVPGQRLFFDAISGGSAVLWNLIEPDGSSLGGPTMSRDFSVIPEVEGRHWLKVFTRGVEPIAYSFMVLLPETQSESLVFNLPFQGVLGPGDIHEYIMEGASGQRFYFDALDTDHEVLRADLIAPDGRRTLVVSDTDRDSRPFTLDEDGAHRLVIGGEQDAVSDYAFRVINLFGTPALPIGTQVNGRLEPRMQAVVFEYEGVAGRALEFVALSGSSQVRWDFYGPDDRDLGGFALSSDFEVTLPSAGFYYLVLGSANTGDPLDFSFQVNAIPQE